MSLLVIHLPKKFINAMDQFIKKSLLAWVSHNHTSSRPKTLVRENHNEDGYLYEPTSPIYWLDEPNFRAYFAFDLIPMVSHNEKSISRGELLLEEPLNELCINSRRQNFQNVENCSSLIF